MSATLTPTASLSLPDTAVPLPPVVPDPCMVLYGVAYDQYATISAALTGQKNLRLVFIDGRLTLLSPLRQHDWAAERLGDLVKAVANGCGILWEDARSSTYRRGDMEVGVEGDDTFYFGANAEIMRGSREIDLATQPPPDLAIEVEVSHPASDAVGVWGRLGVPEVWRFDARRDAISFWLRRDDGTYGPIDRSIGLPWLEPADILGQLRLADELGSARWTMQLADWVRDVIAPRIGRA